MHPDPDVPALVLLTPNARGSLEEMRAIGFAGYLVKPVRQSSLAERLILCCGARRDAPRKDRDGGAGFGRAAAGERAQSPGAPGRWPPRRPTSIFPPFRRPSWKAIPAAARSRTPAVPKSADEGLRILLAEDNPINMMLIRELLRRRGHTVKEVTTGNDAVQAMADGSFDLLLTDIHMPGMDGIEAARAIRAGEARTRPRPHADRGAHRRRTGCGQAAVPGGPAWTASSPSRWTPAELEEMFLMLFPSEERSHIVAA